MTVIASVPAIATNAPAVLSARSCPSSSRSTTRSRCCRRCSRGCIRRSMRSADRYECVFVNDGSKDRPRRCCASNSSGGRTGRGWCCSTRNFGQHSAVMAGSRPRARRLRRHPGCGPAESARGDRQAGRQARRGLRLRRHHPPAAPGHLWRRVLSQGRQQAARMDHAGAHHRSGLHDARLRAARWSTALNQTREVNTFIPALAVALCHEPDRGADRARGAPCRAARSTRCTA